MLNDNATPMRVTLRSFVFFIVKVARAGYDAVYCAIFNVAHAVKQNAADAPL